MSRSGFCQCEAHPIGQIGPITNEEVVSRIIFARQHIGKGGRVLPAVFPLSHIKNVGLSLVRTEKISLSDLERFASTVAQLKSDRTWHGLISFPAQVARDQQIAGVRSVCLWEDPTPVDGTVPANDAHASLVANQEISDAEAMEIRARIWLTNGGVNALVTPVVSS